MDGFLGNRDIVKKLFSWFRRHGEFRGVLLYGPSGIGKTYLVKLICQQFGVRLFELECGRGFARSLLNINAEQGMFGSGGAIVHQQSAILVENVDAFMTSALLAKSLVKLVQHSTVPVFLTNRLRLTSLPVLTLQMSKIPRAQVFNLLLSRKPAHISRKQVAQVTLGCRGDVRYGLNMLPFGFCSLKDCDCREIPSKLVDRILTRRRRYTFQQLEQAYLENSEVVQKVANQYCNYLRELSAAVEISHNLSASRLTSLAPAIVATTLWSLQTVLQEAVQEAVHAQPCKHRALRSLRSLRSLRTVLLTLYREPVHEVCEVALTCTKQTKITDFFLS